MRTWTPPAVALLISVVATGCPSDGGGPAADGDTTGGGATQGSGDTTPSSLTESGGADSDSGGSTSIGTSTGAAESTSASDDAMTDSTTGSPCPSGTVDCPCDGRSCNEGLTCDNEVCVASESACAEHPEGEPNDSEAEAVELGELAGCMVAEINGAIDDGDDDWFVYHGTEDPDCIQDTSGIVTAATDLTTCMFWECDQGTEQVVCFGTPEAVSPDGRPGCCGSMSSVVFMQRNCLGVGDETNGTVYLQVRDPGEPVCIEYALAYIY